MCVAETRIECFLVPEEKRLDFLPDVVGNAFAIFEREVFNWMGILMESYNGGYWDFFRLSNGGFYMALSVEDKEAKVEVVSPNGAVRQVTHETASICAVLFALSQLSFQIPSNERLIDGFHNLRDYVSENLSLQDRKDIFAIMD